MRKILVCFFLCMVCSMSWASVKTWKIGLVQASLYWGNVEQNLVAFSERIKQCEKCDIIVLPELFTSGCLMKKRDKNIAWAEKKRIAKTYTRVVDSLRSWARERQALVMGSTIYEENGSFFNRLVAVTPRGSVYYYDKHNCFKMGGYTPGNKHLVFDYKGLKIATFICYDLRFPEWSRNKMGYDLAVYVANWPDSRHTDWLRLLQERSVENQAIVVGVNCIGEDPNGIKYRGGSSIFDARGNLLGKCTDFSDEINIIAFTR